VKRPQQVEIITYQVGFGASFLLKIHYDRGRPHSILIDFGSTSKEGFSLTDIARQIKSDCKDCDNGLDVVVATHRHKDHVHGFRRTKTGRGTGKVIRDLEPSVVIQPWTEDPKAQPDAVRPTKKYGSQGPAFAARLANMQALAGSIAKSSRMLRFQGERSLRTSLRVLGDNNLGNASAMENLRSMGKRHHYAYHGMELKLARELPGAKVHVLGPPTLKQTKVIEKQRSRDEDEFWHLQARSGMAFTEGTELFEGYKTLKNPVWARWAKRNFRESRARQLLAIVRSLDHQMNNTSLILLLAIGNKKFLFPGDAQYENWMYALSKAWVRRLLQDVDVYKVGHHGSLNATPKSMLELFQKKQSLIEAGGDAMYSLLSTKPGVHGSKSKRTEVPRSSLVKKLDEETQLVSTTKIPVGQISTAIRIPV
jgi:hypothetical protein